MAFKKGMTAYNFDDLTGKTFNRLTVIERVHKENNKRTFFFLPLFKQSIQNNETKSHDYGKYNKENQPCIHYAHAIRNHLNSPKNRDRI